MQLKQRHSSSEWSRMGRRSMTILMAPSILSKNCSVAAWYPQNAVPQVRVNSFRRDRTSARALMVDRYRHHHVNGKGDPINNSSVKESEKHHFAASILSHWKVPTDKLHHFGHDDHLKVAAAPATSNDDETEAHLRQENERLKRQLKEAQDENQLLHLELSNRIVLETFEGEGKVRRLLPLPVSSPTSIPTTTTTSSSTSSITSGSAVDASTAITDVNNDVDLSLESMWCDELDDNDTCPVEPMVSFVEALRDRAIWLVGLLVLQSGSGLILARNEALLADHPFIIYFLTMLVGAGGNAGNQASVRVIRGLALGTLNAQTQSQFLWRELKMATALSVILSLAGFVRAALFATPFAETIAVTVSLTLIVFSSVCLGAVLPLVLKSLRVDPAHSSTSIQVVMDILGVVLAVFVSRVLLDSALGSFLIAKLGG